MHEWTKPRFCMPLPGEIVVVRAKIGHALIQLPYPVQRARNRWCNADNGRVIKDEIVFWRSPTLEEVGLQENVEIEAPSAIGRATADQGRPNFRIDPNTLSKLQKIAAQAHAAPPAPEPAPATALPDAERPRRTLVAVRPALARRAVLQANPHAFHQPVPPRTRSVEIEPGYHRVRGGRSFEAEAEVIRTRYVPRTMR